MKILSDNDFSLIREKKHYVFAHNITNKRVVVSKTTNDKALFRNLNRDMKYASLPMCA